MFLTRKSTIINSSHKSLIDDLLHKGYKTSQILEVLKDKDIIVSRSALYRYKNSHFVSRRQPVTRLYNILIETGNYNLLKALQRTEKIYDTKRRCKCYNIRPEDLRRKGRVFIHRVCGGWYPYDLGTHLKSRYKKQRNSYRFISATARSY